MGDFERIELVREVRTVKGEEEVSYVLWFYEAGLENPKSNHYLPGMNEEQARKVGREIAIENGVKLIDMITSTKIK